MLASDSRSSAGVDPIATVYQLSLFTVAGERMIAVLSAGNLATTRAVITILRQNLDVAHRSATTASLPGTAPEPNLLNVRTMFDAAQFVGDRLRNVVQGNKSLEFDVFRRKHILNVSRRRILTLRILALPD